VIANPPLTYMHQMLRGVIAGGTGTHAAISGWDLAGKTGTTSDYKDAWFCGFSGDVTTVVWLGRDDATPMIRVTGGSAPTELWRDYMRTALPKLHAEPIPPGPPAPLPQPEATPVTAPLTPLAPPPTGPAPASTFPTADARPGL
jgi:penicillin-binding protein 1A